MARLLLILAATLAASAQETRQEQPELPKVFTSIVISAKAVQPGIDDHSAEAFSKTLFSRDDQVFHLLNGGLNAGQHEGGGKSLEIRRFGFNLDHGGVNGGLKVLVDNIQQNQTTQGHGQGYLGSLKSLTPELIEEANLLNGPFSAEYGDFSGLGVVHIRLRESLPDQWTARLQGGSFNTRRAFLAFSPDTPKADVFLAYEGSRTDGPFLKPLDYRRDNVTTNVTKRLNELRSFAVKLSGGRNTYNSSGQIPLDEVDAGRLHPFGFLDPGEGGRIANATLAGYFRQETSSGAVWKLDAFATRSLFDLYSNFTFFLNDPVNGDAIQQHDSRLVHGANLQFLKPHKTGNTFSYLTAGSNFHDNHINVGLYSRSNREPQDTLTAANTRVTNAAAYLQENLSFFSGKLLAGAGLRFDAFRFDIRDRLAPDNRAVEPSARLQPKLSLAYTPTRRLPITLHANYGRGISSIDARSILSRPNGTKLSTTDFYLAGISSRFHRIAVSADAFLIDRSNEMVYIADDGTLDLLGPSRAYGAELKTSVEISRHLSFTGGITQVANAFYIATSPREYVDRAPRFTANAALTIAAWKGWTASFRLRAINGYRLNREPGESPLRAAGNTVTDFSLVRRLRRNLDCNFAIDNIADRTYLETQNYVESRPYPNAPAAFGIHGTPGYPRTITAGLTFRFRGK
jgi:hypothetical protein